MRLLIPDGTEIIGPKQGHGPNQQFTGYNPNTLQPRTTGLLPLGPAETSTIIQARIKAGMNNPEGVQEELQRIYGNTASALPEGTEESMPSSVNLTDSGD